MNDQITCTNISAGYGGPLVIRDINLEIPNGKSPR